MVTSPRIIVPLSASFVHATPADSLESTSRVHGQGVTDGSLGDTQAMPIDMLTEALAQDLYPAFWPEVRKLTSAGKATWRRK